MDYKLEVSVSRELSEIKQRIEKDLGKDFAVLYDNSIVFEIMKKPLSERVAFFSNYHKELLEKQRKQE